VSDHVVHRLERVLGHDPAGALLEAVACAGCGLVVLQPDGMPDYGQVDRLWRAQ
jgi:hypothetical protein